MIATVFFWVFTLFDLISIFHQKLYVFLFFKDKTRSMALANYYIIQRIAVHSIDQ